VLGTRFPFHERPLVSASAQLALASLTLGCHFDVAARVLAFVAEQRRPDGGWGDADDPSDLLTTLVALDLISHFDPAFDPDPTVEYLKGRQGADGFWRAFGPEAPWLTAMVVDQLHDIEQPFAKRFRFPRVQPGPQDPPTIVCLFHGACATVWRNAGSGECRGRGWFHRPDRLSGRSTTATDEPGGTKCCVCSLRRSLRPPSAACVTAGTSSCCLARPAVNHWNAPSVKPNGRGRPDSARDLAPVPRRSWHAHS
jgi:hypothetical protein